MQAYVDGKPIQHKVKGDRLWYTLKQGVIFDFNWINYDYRIEEQFTPPQTIRVNFNNEGELYAVPLGDLGFNYVLAEEKKEYEGIEWRGGSCPVSRIAKVQVKFENGEVSSSRAGNWNWGRCVFEGHTDANIIAYRVVE